MCCASLQALLRVLSNSKVESMTVKLAQPVRLIPVHTKGRPPSYFIIAGLVFGQVRRLCIAALIFHHLLVLVLDAKLDITSLCPVITMHVGLGASARQVLDSSGDQAELHESLPASQSATVLSCTTLCNACMLFTFQPALCMPCQYYTCLSCLCNWSRLACQNKPCVFYVQLACPCFQISHLAPCLSTSPAQAAPHSPVPLPAYQNTPFPISWPFQQS